MFQRESRKDRRVAIHARIRHKIRGTAERPRLAFYKSENHVYAQIIDDEAGRTLASASTVSKSLKGKVQRKGNVAAAKAIGEAIAAAALDCKIDRVVFDRGGLLYHGAVKALADAARAKGLKF
jgi:large subunit ribosomal protein L18